MIEEIKQQIFNILSEDLGYNVSDNPYGSEEDTFPLVRIRLSSCARDKAKNMFQNRLRYQIDIFSDYNGEAEILEMEEAIFEAMTTTLYENENISYVRESGFNITDDKSTGVLRKHGILRYTIYSTGGFIEVDEPDEEDNPETEPLS